MNWEFTPYIVVLLLTGLISVIVAYFAWRLRSKPGGLPTCFLMLAAAEWSFALALESAAVGIPHKVFWSKVEYIGINSIPVPLLMFALEFTHKEKWLNRRRLILLWIIPIITLGLVATNEWHHLIWTGFAPSPTAGSRIVIYSHGAWFWIMTAYIYLSLCATTILLINAALQFRHLYRQQTMVLLLSMIPPWITNALYLLGIGPTSGLELTPSGFALTGMMLMWSFTHLQLLDLAPVARDKVIEDMRDGMLVLDEQNRIVDINPAAQKLIGVDGKSAIGQPAEDILAGQIGLMDRYWGTLEGQAEILINGTCYIELRISPLYERGRRLCGRLIVLRDITERKRAEDKLHEYSERLEAMVEERTKELRDAQEHLVRKEKLATLGQMSGSIAHELRSPLATISNAVYCLKMALPNADASINEYLDIIAKGINNSQKTIAGLLDFSRTRMTEREEIAISEMIAQVLELSPPPENIKVTSQIPSNIPSVFVDSQQMKQVLFNLVINACHAMPDGGELSFTAKRQKDQVALSITDTGIGISKENMNKIFEPLFTTKARGIGLGLALSRNLVEANGGSIEVESEIGKGSTFTITLPGVS